MLLDFKEELKKYKPILTMDDVEKSIYDDEVRDIMDLLSHISNQIEKEK